MGQLGRELQPLGPAEPDRSAGQLTQLGDALVQRR
jgi:hypothetical protein